MSTPGNPHAIANVAQACGQAASFAGRLPEARRWFPEAAAGFRGSPLTPHAVPSGADDPLARIQANEPEASRKLAGAAVFRERQPAVERRVLPRPITRPVLGHQVDVRVG